MSAEEKERALEEQAVAEILKEASRGKEREKTLGTEGWRKPVSRPNKIFIGRSIASALRQTKYDEKVKNRREKKILDSNSRSEGTKLQKSINGKSKHREVYGETSRKRKDAAKVKPADSDNKKKRKRN